MNVKPNDELLFEVYRYAARVTKMAEILQKGGDLTPEQYKEWATLGLQNINDIKDWIKRTAQHIRS